MSEPEGFSSRVDQALILAAIVHRDQRRKGTPVPYIIHPVHVARILERHGWPEDVVIAGLLHDAVEDLEAEDPRRRAQLRAEYGPIAEVPDDPEAFRAAVEAHIARVWGRRVLALVLDVTERKADDGTRQPWLVRKQETVAALGTSDRETVALKAADLLHNVSSIAHDAEETGAGVMRRFNASPRDTLWYYRTAASLVRERLGADDALARELEAAVAGMEDAVARALDVPLRP